MKRSILFFFAILMHTSVSSQNITFADANFKSKLIEADVTNQIAKDVLGNFFKIDANNDSEIELSEALQVSYLDVSDSFINSLDGVLNFTNLTELRCYQNEITTLNVLGLTNLTKLYCMSNQIAVLDVSLLSNLEILFCSNNLLTILNVNGLANLQNCELQVNQISALTFNGLTNLKFLNCSSNNLTVLDVTSLTNLERLSCENNQINLLNVAGLDNLENLSCATNQLTALDLSGVTNLVNLNCAFNQIPQSSLIGLNTSIVSLNYSDNQLTTLNVANFTNLEILLCFTNLLTVLDVAPLTNLKELYCGNNLLPTLDVTNLTNLEQLNCSSNMLTELDVDNCINLVSVFCSNNQIQVLDLNNAINLWRFVADNNQLTTLLFKNGTPQSASASTLFNNPNLTYVCIDNQFSNEIAFGNYITNLYPNCTVNSYCSFVPGGIHYTIEGTTRYDMNTDGCDALDSTHPFLKLSVTNGANSQNIVANALGSYTVSVGQGDYTVTPVLENPSYFTCSPASTTVSFPTTASPFVQDFCITPNGIHNDLEVKVMPLIPARPGNDSRYNLVLKNNGTNTQSGTVDLVFDDSVMDFVFSNSTVSSQTTNSLTWNFTGLLPFQTSQIIVEFNLNSTTETPALNSGDVLNFTASINGLPDETPQDNVSNLHQLVVNSFDPNDKTCLEGTTISPEMIGEYVHYMIRFENNGTANAQNIVVLDRIDVSKLDINTLLTINSSHSFITRITDTNKVEFIFENINLPFDDANNDGYVAFKIKTNSNLVEGDTFSNNASIYFDYNFPIDTNTATTTIQALANPDFEFINYFTLAPNPVKDVLTIQNKSTTEITSLSIYNVLGQLVLTVTEPNASLDVSHLKSGHYYIKVMSPLGSSSSTFIKI